MRLTNLKDMLFSDYTKAIIAIILLLVLFYKPEKTDNTKFSSYFESSEPYELYSQEGLGYYLVDCKYPGVYKNSQYNTHKDWFIFNALADSHVHEIQNGVKICRTRYLTFSNNDVTIKCTTNNGDIILIDPYLYFECNRISPFMYEKLTRHFEQF